MPCAIGLTANPPQQQPSLIARPHQSSSQSIRMPPIRLRLPTTTALRAVRTTTPAPLRTFTTTTTSRAASVSSTSEHGTDDPEGHHGHESHYDPPTGWLWGIPPGEKYEKEGWEGLMYYGFLGSIIVAGIAYAFKPDTSYVLSSFFCFSPSTGGWACSTRDESCYHKRVWAFADCYSETEYKRGLWKKLVDDWKRKVSSKIRIIRNKSSQAQNPPNCFILSLDGACVTWLGPDCLVHTFVYWGVMPSKTKEKDKKRARIGIRGIDRMGGGMKLYGMRDSSYPVHLSGEFLPWHGLSRRLYQVDVSRFAI